MHNRIGLAQNSPYYQWNFSGDGFFDATCGKWRSKKIISDAQFILLQVPRRCITEQRQPLHLHQSPLPPLQRSQRQVDLDAFDQPSWDLFHQQVLYLTLKAIVNIFDQIGVRV
jgi:hypothetical protein